MVQVRELGHHRCGGLVFYLLGVTWYAEYYLFSFPDLHSVPLHPALCSRTLSLSRTDWINESSCPLAPHEFKLMEDTNKREIKDWHLVTFPRTPSEPCDWLWLSASYTKSTDVVMLSWDPLQAPTIVLSSTGSENHLEYVITEESQWKENKYICISRW